MKGFMRFFDPFDVARMSIIDDTSRIDATTKNMPATALVAENGRFYKFQIFSVYF